MSIESKQVFLIQESGWKPAQHLTAEFPDRTYAEEAILFGYYRNDDWDIKKRDQDFGKARVGDYVLAYYTGDVEESPSQIRYIYEITGIERIPSEQIQKTLEQGKIKEDDANRLREKPHILRLKVHQMLQRGLELALIRKWVSEDKLSKNMNNCGIVGFNICQVDFEDYKTILEWDKEVPVIISLPEPYEETLRQYIVKKSIADKSLAKILDDRYMHYKLYEDANGKTGELYNTPIGQIDILYCNEKTGDFLVIELKRTSETSDDAVGQIARYIGWVQENLARQSNVQGIIIAQSASEELKYAVKAMKDCTFATYEVEFNITFQ